MVLDGRNGQEILDSYIKKVAEYESTEPADGGSPETNLDDTYVLKLAESMEKAARQLGDGKSSNPRTHTPKEEPLSNMGEANTDPVAEAKKGPEISSTIKEAVLNLVELEPTEKVAQMGGLAKALMVSLPLAGLGSGYAVGRFKGKSIDEKNNQAYYQAGVYDGARRYMAAFEEHLQNKAKDNEGEKTAAAKAGLAKALKIGIPTAAVLGGAGYAGGRFHGKKIDQRNNPAYYYAGQEHGIVAAEQSVIQQIKDKMRQKQGKGE